jgi:hypothetical protein
MPNFPMTNREERDQEHLMTDVFTILQLILFSIFCFFYKTYLTINFQI